MKKGQIKKTKDEEKTMSLADKINIAIAVISALSVLFALITVVEIKKDRKAAYKPAVLINPIECEFTWDSNGNEIWMESMAYNSAEKIEFNEDGTLEGTINIPIKAISESGLEKITTVNAGVGNARDVIFEWDENNINRLNEYLIKCNEQKKEFMYIDKSVVFTFNDGLVMTDIPGKHGLMYMVSNAGETYNIPVPMAYSILIHEIIKTKKYDEDLPYLFLSAKYYDVLGNKTEDVFLVQIKPRFIKEDEAGSGKAIFQLIPALSTP